MTVACLRAADGTVLPLDIDRWHDLPTPEELDVLDRVQGPAIDLGCGPGRHVIALGERGVPAMGVDAAPSAVATARTGGALVLERSVFSRIPGVRRWGTVLLLDGNIGIGGDPVRLLRRTRELLRPHGIVLVEVQTPGSPTRVLEVAMERGTMRSDPFSWAIVGADALPALAAAADFGVTELWQGGDRWFARLATY